MKISIQRFITSKHVPKIYLVLTINYILYILSKDFMKYKTFEVQPVVYLLASMQCYLILNYYIT